MLGITVERAADAALELRTAELWDRLCEAARDPRVASARMSAEPIARGAAGPRQVGSRALAVKLDIAVTGRAAARRLAEAAGAPAPTFGSADAVTPRVLSALAELLRLAPADAPAVTETAAWLIGVLAEVRAVLGYGRRVITPRGRAVEVVATPQGVPPCRACGGRMHLPAGWEGQRSPWLVCRCGATVALGDLVPEALPLAVAPTTVTTAEAAEQHGVPYPSLVRWLARSGIRPVGSRAGARAFPAAAVAALIAARGRTLAVASAPAVA